MTKRAWQKFFYSFKSAESQSYLHLVKKIFYEDTDVADALKPFCVLHYLENDTMLNRAAANTC